MPPPEKSKQAVAKPDDVTTVERPSVDVIYDAVMRGGGEPFGAPFESGVSTLTEKVVKLFKLAGFFGFETMEKLRRRNRRNKFTRHGAAPFAGDYRPPKRK